MKIGPISIKHELTGLILLKTCQWSLEHVNFILLFKNHSVHSRRHEKIKNQKRKTLELLIPIVPSSRDKYFQGSGVYPSLNMSFQKWDCCHTSCFRTTFKKKKNLTRCCEYLSILINVSLYHILTSCLAFHYMDIFI